MPADRDRGGPGSRSPAARTPPDWAAGSARPSSPGAAAPDDRRSSRRGERRRAPRRRRAGRRSASAPRRSGGRRPGRSCGPPTGRPRTRPSTARRTSGRRRPCGRAAAARPPRARARRPMSARERRRVERGDDVQPAGTLLDADDDVVSRAPSSAATATAGHAPPRRRLEGRGHGTVVCRGRRSCRARRRAGDDGAHRQRERVADRCHVGLRGGHGEHGPDPGDRRVELGDEQLRRRLQPPVALLADVGAAPDDRGDPGGEQGDAGDQRHHPHETHPAVSARRPPEPQRRSDDDSTTIRRRRASLESHPPSIVRSSTTSARWCSAS